MRTEGIDLEDGGEPLLDLRFADDILVFATSSRQAAYLLDELVVALADVGLILNEDKTKLLTTQAQPPKTITTPRGVRVAGSDAFCVETTREVTGRTLNTICRLHRGRSLPTETFFATRLCP